MERDRCFSTPANSLRSAYNTMVNKQFQKLLDLSDDWLRYGILIRLCNEPKSVVVEARNAALADRRIQSYMSDVKTIHNMPIKNHKNPELPIQKLLFLLDLGFDTDIPEINDAIFDILEHQDEHGVYQSLTNVPKHFGGSGLDDFGWSLCDAPLLLLSLLLAGVEYHKYIKPGVDHLITLSRDNGFPCAVSAELGKFHGPGKKSDCCPYATLIMANLLSYIPEYRDSQVAVSSVKMLLSLWQESLTLHPYLFYMGADFRKLKAPSNWYDIVSVAGVLSKYEFVSDEPCFLEMIAIIRGKQDEDGFFTPESVYQKLKDWDFGQKKLPSPYLTFLCYRIFQRLEEVNYLV